MNDPPAGAGSGRPRVAIVTDDPPALDHAARELLEQLTEHAVPGHAASDILHVGDEGLALAVDAFGVARDHNPRLRLVHVGASDAPRRSLGSHAVHVPEPTGDELAALYASSDLLLATDPGDAGAGILEAQASGLPVLAVNTGAAPELIANGRDGCLIVSDPLSIAAALQGLARRAALLERLATGGLLAVRTRTWEVALEQLAEAYSRALEAALGEIARAA